MSVFQRAIRIGRRSHRKVAGVPVVYVGANDEFTLNITLTPGIRTSEGTTEEGVVITRMEHEWIGEMSDFPRAPQRFDTIYWNGTAYRVVHPGGGREYDERDPYRESYRIYTVIVDDEQVEPPVPGVDDAYGTSVGDTYANSNNEEYGPPTDGS